MNKKLTIEMSSNLEYEGMVIDITYNKTTIASINYDKGINNMEIEMFAFGSDTQKIIFPLQDFLDILDKAKQLSLKCAEEDRMRNQE